jgi:hypothetical protein
MRLWLPLIGLGLLALMLLPPVRHAAESSMTAHMLLQYPALLLAGALLAAAMPQRGQRALQRFNQFGIAGLMTAALTMALLMVPRVLDLALADARVESLKLLALVASGAALALSWRRAGTVIQAFFLGNMLPMLAVVGTLYEDSPARLCNAYRLDDQQTLGAALLWLSLGIAAVWLLCLMLRQSPSLDVVSDLRRPARPPALATTSTAARLGPKLPANISIVASDGD